MVTIDGAGDHGSARSARTLRGAHRSFCRTDPAFARVFARTTFLSDNRADLARVSLPTLVIECAHDTLAPREVGTYVQQRIDGSELVTLDANGHCPQLSAPDVTAQAIAAFAGES